MVSAGLGYWTLDPDGSLPLPHSERLIPWASPRRATSIHTYKQNNWYVFFSFFPLQVRISKKFSKSNPGKQYVRKQILESFFYLFLSFQPLCQLSQCKQRHIKIRPHLLLLEEYCCWRNQTFEEENCQKFSHWGFSGNVGGAYSSRKGLAPWRGQCRQPCADVPPLRPSGWSAWAAPPTKKYVPESRGF